MTFCVIAAATARCSFPRRAVTNAIKIVRHLARLYHTRHFRAPASIVVWRISMDCARHNARSTQRLGATTQTNPLMYVKQRFRLEITLRQTHREKTKKKERV